MANKRRNIPSDSFEDNVIHTYKHFLQKSKEYFIGNLANSIQDEIKLLNLYDDNAIARAYNYYDSKLLHKLEIFRRIGAKDLVEVFQKEYQKLGGKATGVLKRVKEEETKQEKVEVKADMIKKPFKLYEITWKGKKMVVTLEYLKDLVEKHKMSKKQMEREFENTGGKDIESFARSEGFVLKGDAYVPIIFEKLEKARIGQEFDKGEDLSAFEEVVGKIKVISFNPDIKYLDVDEKTSKNFNDRYEEIKERHPEVYKPQTITQTPEPKVIGVELPEKLYEITTANDENEWAHNGVHALTKIGSEWANDIEKRKGLYAMLAYSIYINKSDYEKLKNAKPTDIINVNGYYQDYDSNYHNRIFPIKVLKFDADIVYNTEGDEGDWFDSAKSYNERIGKKEVQQVPTELKFVIKNTKGQYLGKHIENGLPIFDYKTDISKADRYDDREDAEEVVTILQYQFPNETFVVNQEDVPIGGVVYSKPTIKQVAESYYAITDTNTGKYVGKRIENGLPFFDWRSLENADKFKVMGDADEIVSVLNYLYPQGNYKIEQKEMIVKRYGGSMASRGKFPTT